jgi:hypothetical protein
LNRFVATATKSTEASKGKTATHENSGTVGVGLGVGVGFVISIIKLAVCLEYNPVLLVAPAVIVWWPSESPDKVVLPIKLVHPELSKR